MIYDSHSLSLNFHVLFLAIDNLKVSLKAFYLAVANFVDIGRITQDLSKEIFSLFIIKDELIMLSLLINPFYE
jgi:hypothetical protein